MKRIHDPRLLDHLASAYALGTLRGGARRRLETLARDHATVRAAMLVWQARVSALTELQEPVRPSSAVWTRIHNLVRADVEAGQIRQVATAPAPATPGGWWQSLALWRGGAVAGVLATVVAVMSAIGLREEMDTRVAALQSELASQPQVQYVAVLNDDRAGPAMLVTFDPANQRLTLQRVGGYQEASDKSLQLWALPPAAHRVRWACSRANACCGWPLAKATSRVYRPWPSAWSPKAACPASAGRPGRCCSPAP
jgi:anti-sigma-K factor RskA